MYEQIPTPINFICLTFFSNIRSLVCSHTKKGNGRVLHQSITSIDEIIDIRKKDCPKCQEMCQMIENE